MFKVSEFIDLSEKITDKDWELNALGHLSYINLTFTCFIYLCWKVLKISDILVKKYYKCEAKIYIFAKSFFMIRNSKNGPKMVNILKLFKIITIQ